MSTIAVDNVKPSAGGTSVDLLAGLAKSWVNFTGTSGAVINESVNMASVTDHATGDFTFTFTSAFISSTFASLSQGKTTVTHPCGICTSDNATEVSTAIRVDTENHASAVTDPARGSIACMGDLA